MKLTKEVLKRGNSEKKRIKKDLKTPNQRVY